MSIPQFISNHGYTFPTLIEEISTLDLLGKEFVLLQLKIITTGIKKPQI
jgi:hypothetical protein